MNKKTPTQERYFSILLEDVDSKLRQIFEGQDVIRAEFKSELGGFKSEVRNNFKTVFEYLSRM